jgi:ComF family protein
MTALLAPVCAVCGAILDEPLSGCVCQSCWGSIRPITPPLCDRCGDPLAIQHQPPIPNPESPVGGPCAQCDKTESAVDRARAVGEYEGALREIIHALKYERRRSLARPVAALMRSRGAALLGDTDFIVPVPLHWRREHQRGFNQARELACHLGPPVVNMLARRRRTRPQVELAADRRRANVEGAFRLRRPWCLRSSIEGRRVLLVDDVSTTGATLESCACVLKEGGASEVYALTAARVVTARPHGRP